jgi:hypothetical protein
MCMFMCTHPRAEPSGKPAKKLVLDFFFFLVNFFYVFLVNILLSLSSFINQESFKIRKRIIGFI